MYRLAAAASSRQAHIDFERANPHRVGRGTVTGRVVLTGQAVHVDDVLADPEYNWPAAAENGIPDPARRADPQGRRASSG